VLAFFGARADGPLPNAPRWNICPTMDIDAALLDGDGSGARLLRRLRWGFLPRWYETPTSGPLLINARAETVAEKPAFREAARKRRCLIPADGFYEWRREADGRKQPFWITPAAGGLIAFAGIGRPEKFFAALRRLGADVRATRAFSDHAPYSPRALARLEAEAARLGARLVTTEKDAVRLPESFRGKAMPLPVHMVPRDGAAFAALLDAALARRGTP
jgi:hypothetical protein